MPAFVLAVGMTEIASGLIASIPMLAGGILQMISPWAVRALRSNRRWVVLCALSQALSFLPLIYAALHGSMSTLGVLAVASIYWGAGMGTGPAWNSWMSDVIPRRIRARYFACRSRIGQGAVLAGFLAGGMLLQGGTAVGYRLPTFALIFTIACVSRLYSAWLHLGQPEPIRPDPNAKQPSFSELVGIFRNSSTGKLLCYLLAMQFAVNISGPYFNAFMLMQLKLTYFEYVLLIAAAFLARMLSLPVHGWLAHRFGPRALLWIGGLGIVPTSSMWLFSDHYGYLLFVQAVGGTFWAGYELAIFLLFFDAIRPEQRTSVLTAYNFGNAVALVLGSLTGGALLGMLGEYKSSYLALFVISGLVRFCTVPLLARVKDADSEPSFTIATRTLAVRPATGTIERPVLATLPAASGRSR
ncbi:MAG: MFS transporter [Planctomycetota bacterium]